MKKLINIRDSSQYREISETILGVTIFIFFPSLYIGINSLQELMEGSCDLEYGRQIMMWSGLILGLIIGAIVHEIGHAVCGCCFGAESKGFQ